MKVFPLLNWQQPLLICCLLFCNFVVGVECKCEVLTRNSSYFCSGTLCKSVNCEEIKNCSGVILPNASYCSCCPVCVKYLDANSFCEDEQGSLAKVERSRCKEGLKCKNNKCVLNENGNLNSCLIQHHLRSLKRKTANYSQDLWLPECDKKGEFQSNQTKDRRTMCLDKYGNKIMGTGGKSTKNACVCSRHMQTLLTEDQLSFNIRPQEHCSSSGNFEKVQCQNHLCYCADEGNGKIKGRLVRRDNLEKLPCYEDGISEKKYLKHCEEELQRSRHLEYEFFLKGVELVGAHTVKCDPDGTFSAKQCQTDRCVCTDSNGVGIGSYAIATEDLEKLDNIGMTCNCAREAGSARNPFLCKGYGNYAHVQCFNSQQCFCVDDDGDIISKPLTKATVKEDYCLKLLHNLLVFPGLRVTVTDTRETDDYDYDYAKEYN